MTLSSRPSPTMMAAILLPYGATGLAVLLLASRRDIVSDATLVSVIALLMPFGPAPLRVGHLTLECLALGQASFWAAIALCMPTAVPPRSDVQVLIKGQPRYMQIGSFGCGLLAGAWGLLRMRYGGPTDRPYAPPDPRFDVSVGVLMVATAGLLMGIAVIYVVAYVWPQRSSNGLDAAMAPGREKKV